MAQISNEALRQAIERVTAEVTGEVKTFEVADLHTQLTDLAKVGGANAWEISYKTTSAQIAKESDLSRAGSAVAWEISYKTSSAAIEKGGSVQKG